MEALNPDGTIPDINSKEDLQAWIKTLTITPENYLSRTYGDYPEWGRDSGELFGHGLMWGTDVPIPLVKGAIYLTLNDGKERVAEAVLTQNFVFIYWYSWLKKNVIMIQHKDKMAVEPIPGSNSTAHFYFRDVSKLNGRNNGIIGKSMGQTKCEISGRFTKDLHQNRRTLSFWRSYAAFLGELKEHLKP